MIHLARDGTQLGQFTPEQVNEMLAAGQLRLSDLAWREGLPSWVPLARLDGVPLSSASATASSAATPAPQPVTGAVPASVYAPPRGTVSGSFHQPGQVPPGSIQALKETRPWVLFLAILGIVVTGFMLLAALTMLLAGGLMASKAGMPAGMPSGMMAAMSVAYLILAIIYLYPIIKLFKYSGAIKRLSHSGAAADLDEAMRQQKSFWKFIGVLTLIMMVIYFIAIVAMIVGGFSAASMGIPSPPPPPPAP